MKKLFLKSIGISVLMLIVSVVCIQVQTTYAQLDESIFFENSLNSQLEFAPVGENAVLPVVVDGLNAGVGGAQGAWQGYQEGGLSGAWQGLQQGAANSSMVYQGVQTVRRTADNIQQAAEIVTDPGMIIRHLMMTGMYWYAQFIALITGLVGKMFDMVLNTVTPSMASDWQRTVLAGIYNGIESSWKIMRDLASLVIVFSLLYLGIKTIINGNGFADRKALIAIIVAAILVNFSLVLTRDVAFHLSNRIGNEVLKSVEQQGGNARESYSASILGIVGPQTLFANQPVLADSKGTDFSQVFSKLGQVIFLTLVLIVCIWIFVALIGVLVYRFIIFVVLMIFSPLGLVAFAIPWLNNHGKKWLDELKKQAIFYPAFIFCMYIVFLIIGTLSIGNTGISFPSFGGGSWTEQINMFVQSTIGFFFNFVLIIGFLVLLVILPSKIGSAGSGLITKAGSWSGKKIRGYATRGTGKVVFGTTAAIGRNSIGRISANIVNSDKWKERAQKSGFAGGAARVLMRQADKAQNYSFDARNTKSIGEFSKKYDLGAAQKGWTDTIKEKTKAIKAKEDKEKKLFGYDKMADTTENRVKIAQAQTQRENKETELNEHKKHLDEVRKRDGVTEAEINVALDYVKKAEEELKTLETEVGRLKNIGDDAYFKNVTSQAQTIKRLGGSILDSAIKKVTKGKIEGRTTQATLTAYQKELNKRWQASGESAQKKRDRARDRRIDTTLNPPDSSTGS